MNHRTIWNGLIAVVLTITLGATSTMAAGISASIELNTLAPSSVDVVDLGLVPTGNVVFGLTTPLTGLDDTFPTDDPDTTVATFATSDVTFSLPYTFNALSSASDNVLGALDGALFRLEAQTGGYSVGITGDGDEFDGSGHSESGDYLISYGQIDPTTLGGDFDDTDPTNDTAGGADVITLGTSDAKVAVNSFDTSGDVDWYAITLTSGDIFSAITAPLDDLSSSFDFPDTRLFLVAPDGTTILVDNEDAGGVGESVNDPTLASDNPYFAGGPSVFGSALNFLAPADGTYYLVVSGFSGTTTFGSHGESGDYGLLVSRYVPEPTSIALIGLGALMIARRRRV